MGKSIEAQRESLRLKREGMRFHDVRHLKIDPDKIKCKPRLRDKKVQDVYQKVEKLLGEDYYSPSKGNKKIEKSRKKGKKPRKAKSLTEKQIKYREYLQSNEWVQLRIDLLEYRGYVCERCPNTKRLQVHHLNYANVFNEEPEDLEILCRDCHKKEHGIK